MARSTNQAQIPTVGNLIRLYHDEDACRHGDITPKVQIAEPDDGGSLERRTLEFAQYSLS